MHDTKHICNCSSLILVTKVIAEKLLYISVECSHLTKVVAQKYVTICIARKNISVNQCLSIKQSILQFVIFNIFCDTLFLTINFNTDNICVEKPIHIF